jgi:hypothetical protein
MKPHILAALAAVLDLLVAGTLIAVGMTAFGVFMAAVAVGGFALAAVLWRRDR